MADKYCKDCKKNNGVGHTCDVGEVFSNYEQRAQCDSGREYEAK